MSDDADSRLKPDYDRAEDQAKIDQDEIDQDRGAQSSAPQVDTDQVIEDRPAGYPYINLAWIINNLRQNLPPDDPTPAELVKVFRLFVDYHIRLNDWNDLHNQLSDILFNYGQFSREVERLSDSNEDPEPRAIGIHWHPVAQRGTALLDWASVPRSIFPAEPFARLQDRMIGPAWAVELCKSSDRLESLTRPADIPRLFLQPREPFASRSQYVDINELYDAGSEFYDVAERWMYLVDRHVHKITKELLNLSRLLLSTLVNDRWTA